MAENVVGKVALGIELTSDSIKSQEPELRKAAEQAGGKGGEALNKGFVDKLKEGSKQASSEMGKSGTAAGKTFAEKVMGALSSNKGSLVKTVSKIAGAMAAAFATKKIFDFANQAAEFGDNVDKMSQKIGISRKAYQEWAHIMEHCGSNVDVLQTGMKTLATNVQSESKYLKQLGIDTEKALGMSTEDLFNTVISKLQDMEEGTQRTAIASKLFGRSASEMAAVLNMSSKDMEAMKQNLHAMGGVMSDQSVAASAAFKDALTDLHAGLQGIKNTIGAAVLPAFTTFINGALIPAIKVVSQFTQKIANAISVVGAFLSAIFGIEPAAAKATKSLGVLGEDGVGAVDGISGAAADAINGVTGVGGAARKAAQKAKKAAQDLKRTLEGFDQITKVKEPEKESGGGSGGGGGGGAAGAELDTVAFKNSSDEISGEATKLSGKLQRIAAKIRKTLEKIKTYFVGWYNRYIKPTIESIKDTWDKCCKKIKEGYDKYMAPVLSRLKSLYADVIEQYIKPGIERLGRVINKFWEKILKPLLLWISSVLMPVLAPLVDIIGTTLAIALAAAGTAFDVFIGVIETAVDAVGWLIEKIEEVVNWFNNIPDKKEVFIDLIKNGWNTVAEWVKEKIGGTVEKSIDLAKNGWNSVASWVKDRIGDAVSKAIGLSKNGWDSVGGWVKDRMGDAVNKAIGLSKSWTSVASWVKGYIGDAVNKAIGLSKNNWSSVASWVKERIGGTVSVGIKLFKSGWSSIKSFFGLSGGGIVSHGIKLFESGGQIKKAASSFWKNIPKYAGGTSEAHGTMFLAGEHGAEVVGNVNGATEVLNKSQIAAAVASGVARVISRAGTFNNANLVPHLAVIESHTVRQTASLEAMANRLVDVSSGGNMAEIIAILKQILVILNEIMNQPIYLDGQDIRKRIVNLINAHTQATGRCEIVT